MSLSLEGEAADSVVEVVGRREGGREEREGQKEREEGGGGGGGGACVHNSKQHRAEACNKVFQTLAWQHQCHMTKPPLSHDKHGHQ